MGRLLGGIAGLFKVIALGTFFAQLALLAFLISKGSLSQDRLGKVVALLQGQELPPPPAETKSKSESAPPTPDDVLLLRAAKLRDIELREAALENRADQVKFEQANLGYERDRYTQTKGSFDAELGTLREGAKAASLQNARALLESLKPKQAKDQVLRMMEAGDVDKVVQILSGMGLSKQAKIFAEFKTEEESKKLAEILMRIRDGVPIVPLVEQTANELQHSQADGEN